MKKNIVIKLGTSSLTAGTESLSLPFIENIVQQLAALHKEGVQLTVVSSGSIAAGREILQDWQPHRSLPEKQMLAAIGQVQLMHVWKEVFAKFKIQVGQLLLTRSDFSNRKRYLNARNTIEALLEHRIVPIINENDTVATAEIQVGDNDNLSALVANLIGADLLVLLTDQPGLYNANPLSNPNAEVIPVIEHIDKETFALAGKLKTGGLGTGGMWTKLEAAQIAMQSGIPTVIAAAAEQDVIVKLAKGQHIGSLFPAKTTPKESRRRWILSDPPQGEIEINAGAEKSICKQGGSLLPVGITGLKKPFERGALVSVASASGKSCAVGIVNYSREEIEKIKGKHSSEIEAVLGYSFGPEVIHRDNMAVGIKS